MKYDEFIKFLNYILIYNSKYNTIMKKANVLITSYYGIREQLLEATTPLKRFGCNIFDFHLMEQIFSNPEKYVQEFIDIIQKENITTIIWWYMPVDNVLLEKMQSENITCKNIYYNWDDPFNRGFVDMLNKSKYLDVALISSKDTEYYLLNSCNEVETLYPGFSDTVHFPIDLKLNNEQKTFYECDISICCTNLYDDDLIYDKQYIKRKKLIDDIYNNQKIFGYTFKIYGPEKFAEMYPDSYNGFVGYYNTYLVFNHSKINICTHVISEFKGYLNERVFLILASKGLLFIDKTCDTEEIIKNNETCVVIDKLNYIEQINEIINNYSKYEIIKENGNKIVNNYSWNHWAQNVYKHII